MYHWDMQIFSELETIKDKKDSRRNFDLPLLLPKNNLDRAPALGRDLSP